MSKYSINVAGRHYDSWEEVVKDAKEHPSDFIHVHDNGKVVHIGHGTE